jgi:membrane protease YdiL (CAAX protease family)
MMAYQHERPFLLILTAITAGIVEELIFRGYMLPRLDTLLNNQWAAIIIVSVLYAALYYTYGTWLNILIPFLGSIVFGFFYLKYRSLTVVVLARICALLILGAIRF